MQHIQNNATVLSSPFTLLFKQLSWTDIIQMTSMCIKKIRHHSFQMTSEHIKTPDTNYLRQAQLLSLQYRQTTTLNMSKLYHLNINYQFWRMFYNITRPKLWRHLESYFANIHCLSYLVLLHVHDTLEIDRVVRPEEIPVVIFRHFLEAEPSWGTPHYNTIRQLHQCDSSFITPHFTTGWSRWWLL